LSTEELSKLWSALQSKYRPSVAYQASVVLIESRIPGKAPLPVLTRGYPDAVTGRDRGVIAQPSLAPAYPVLQTADPPGKQTAVRMGETLTLTGQKLDGVQVLARFTHVRSSKTCDLSPQPGAAATGFQVRVPPDPATGPVTTDSPLNPENWQAGLYSVAAVIQTVEPEGTRRRVTNELPVVLAPLVKTVAVNAAGGDVILTVSCSPKVRRGQRVTLVVGEHEIPAAPLPATQDRADQLTFKATTSDLPSGKYWYRLRVDGVESLLVNQAGAWPQFDTAQQVLIP
jgi:hypothetical protein